MDGTDIISMHFNLSDRCIQIDNIYNPVNTEEISAKIPILKHKLAAHLNK